MSFTQLYRPHAPYFILGFLWISLTNLANAILPRLMNAGVNAAEKGGDVFLRLGFVQSQMSMWMLLAMLIFVAVFGGMVRVFSRTVLFNVGRLIERDVRSVIFAHLSQQSSSFYQRHNVGQLMNYLTADVTNIRLFVGFAVLNMLNLVIVFIVNVPFLFALDWLVALTALLPFLLVTFFNYILMRSTLEHMRNYQVSVGNLGAHVQENLGAALLVRLFHQEKAEEERFEHRNYETFRSGLLVGRIRTLMAPMTRVAMGLGVALTLFVAGRAVLMGILTLGDFVEVNVRLLQLAWPAISLGFIISVYGRAKVSLKRINGILDEKEALKEGELTLPLQGDIQLQSLSFSVEDKFLLSDINCQFEANQLTGIVGKNGAGKSILLRLLMRQYLPSAGQIKLDGHDIGDFSLQCLRAGMAMVPQEPFLFSMSLRDNIAFACEGASDLEVEDVIEMVGLSGDVALLAQGIHTLVGEKGIMLSGGQRQRVALARALIVKPRILFLDDALSALDVKTQEHILSRLYHMPHPPTIIMVSHRLSAVVKAHAILVLDKGRLVDTGKHADLLKRSAVYAALWGKELAEKSLQQEGAV